MLERGARWADLVDDCTIRAELNPRAKYRGPNVALLTDDPRLAVWAEAACWAETPDPAHLLRPFADSFGGGLGAAGEHNGRTTEIPLFDRAGQLLAALAPPERDRERVAEVVTRPLGRQERAKALGLILEEARALGFAVPQEAAFHVHLDAAPWQDSARLARLIDRGSRELEGWRHRFGANPCASRVGHLPGPILALAADLLAGLARGEAPPPFEELAARVRREGPGKFCDLNILGVVQPRARQATLELRFLPMSLDAEALLRQTLEVEALLAAIWR